VSVFRTSQECLVVQMLGRRDARFSDVCQLQQNLRNPGSRHCSDGLAVLDGIRNPGATSAEGGRSCAPEHRGNLRRGHSHRPTGGRTDHNPPCGPNNLGTPSLISYRPVLPRVGPLKIFSGWETREAKSPERFRTFNRRMVGNPYLTQLGKGCPLLG
jgi:hypothetical protein